MLNAIPETDVPAFHFHDKSGYIPHLHDENDHALELAGELE